MSTTTVAAATPLRIDAEYVFRLTEPTKVSDRILDRSIVATRIHWRHTADLGSGYNHFDVTAFTDEHGNVTITSIEDNVPSWVPRPPAGWNAAVVAFVNEHAAAVSQ